MESEGIGGLLSRAHLQPGSNRRNWISEHSHLSWMKSHPTCAGSLACLGRGRGTHQGPALDSKSGSVSGLFSELVTLNAFPVFFYNSNSPDTFAQGLWCPGAAQGTKPVRIRTKQEQDTNTVHLSVPAGLCGHNPDVTGGELGGPFPVSKMPEGI
ncbi:hypothetical protein mRhiFer1_008327 [Rhinolophus ferrumequinum]|uniref:Uncharacterized protein n=1 Tax=Rhinolophus ferrumequinum TaxID=59479 RepID=A0A7J7VRJ0_RHIFE|nr:hypothetical protein mRhiFer1_008327 [Rhinolophus ferrumequinum]